MKRISLNSRTSGSEFAAFERELLRPDKHAGYVKHIGNGFISLKKSPFSEHYSDCYYKVPEDIRLNEGDLVDLNVGPLRWVGVKVEDTVYPSYKASFRDVRRAEKGMLKLPRPRIDAKDFQYFLTEQWRDADQDALGRSLALQMLSCPADVYGNGGIGAQSICLSTRKAPLLDLKSTIRNNLPLEFTSKEDDRYRFDVIEKDEQMTALHERLAGGRGGEMCFNFLTIMNPVADPLPVQVPTTIINAHKVGVEKEPNLDVLEYLLSSLMLRPIVKRSAISEIEAGLKLIKEQVEPESASLDLPIDRYAITKLAMAICRMEGKEELDDMAFSRSRETFFDLYREFLDTRKDEFKPGKGAYGRKGVRSAVSGQLDANDLILLSYVRKISRAQGKEYVTLEDIRSELGRKRFRRFDLGSSLDRLNDFGRIIRSENMTAFKAIDLD